MAIDLGVQQFSERENATRRKEIWMVYNCVQLVANKFVLCSGSSRLKLMANMVTLAVGF